MTFVVCFLLPLKREGKKSFICSLFPPLGDPSLPACYPLIIYILLNPTFGKDNSNPLQYSCLENPRGRGAWWPSVHRVAKSWTWLKQLCTHGSDWEFYCSSFLSALCVVTSVVSNSLQPYGLKPSRLLCPWNSPGKNTGVGCHSFLQGIFPTQGSNPGLLHCRQILYPLSLLGNPKVKVIVY